MTAEDRGWGKGWPDCQRDKIVPLTVEGVSFPGGVRREVAPIFAAFLREFHAQVEQLRSGWCWGFACRPIRGSSRPSNHSWGLAVDINAPRHPMGRRGTFSAAQATAIRRLCGRYGMRWGGDYSGRADEMHVEYMGTPTQAARLARRLDNLEEGDGMEIKRGDSGGHVAALQHRLKEWYGADVTVNGNFGPQTETALRSWEQSVGLPDDGVFSKMDYILFGSQRSDARDRDLRADIANAGVSLEWAPADHTHEATVTVDPPPTA